jgi:hypothetical protein
LSKRKVVKKKVIATKGTFKLGKLNISINGRLGYKSKEWEALKAYCTKRDGGKICEKKRTKDCFGAIQLHHKRSLTDGGTNRPKNLGWICHYHHCLVHPFMIKALIKQAY